MTTYWVDGVTGSDTLNDGLSRDTPFATPQKAASVWSAMDQIVLFGGQTYNLTARINMVALGTITQADIGETTRPILDGGGGAFDGIYFPNVHGDLSFLEIQNCGGSSNAFSGIMLDAPSGECNIEHVFTHHNGVNGINMTDTTGAIDVYARFVKAEDNGQQASGQGDGIGSRGGTRFYAEDCITRRNKGGTGVSDGITSHGTGFMIVKRHLSEDDGDCAHMTATGNHLIEDSVFLRPNETLVSATNGSTVVVNRCVGVQISSTGYLAQGGGDLTVRNTNHVVAAVDTGTNSKAFYANDNGGASSLTIQNCTMLSFSTAATNQFRGYRADGTASITIRNYTSYLFGPAHLHGYIIAATVTADIDYSCVYPAEANVKRFYDGTGTLYFADWQTAGYDQNGIGADPEIEFPLGSSPLSTDPHMAYARLKPTSPCIGAGEDLSLDFSDDGFGGPRVDWDIGAVAYRPLQNRNALEPGLEIGV